jgi:putative sigma-54 modulation protein
VTELTPPREDAMRLQIKGRNVEVTTPIRDYTESKLARIDRQLSAETPVEIELVADLKHAHEHTAEGTVFTKGPTLRASESAPELRASIDLLAENLERQVSRYQEKRCEEPRRRTTHHGV